MFKNRPPYLQLFKLRVKRVFHFCDTRIASRETGTEMVITYWAVLFQKIICMFVVYFEQAE